jgi:hypothetical protein
MDDWVTVAEVALAGAVVTASTFWLYSKLATVDFIHEAIAVLGDSESDVR